MSSVEIVERIMTMHWDLTACHCWICEAGRKEGCRPREEYTTWRTEGYSYVDEWEK